MKKNPARNSLLKKGPSKSLGIAIEIGFVPSLFSFPPTHNDIEKVLDGEFISIIESLTSMINE